MANLIEHCGKRFRGEEAFIIVDYPAKGDTALCKRTKCKQCGHLAYTYAIQFQGFERNSEWFQAPVQVAKYFNDQIKQGLALCVEKKAEKSTKGMMIVSEGTLKLSRPADIALVYIDSIMPKTRSGS